ncbi:MAG: serine/threonine-protein kinase [Polyangiaceae bacterium]
MDNKDPFGIVGTTQAGTYHVERMVAEGGWGVVYRAYHGAFHAPVALKLLKLPEGLSDAEQKEVLEKFRAEAEVMFRLSSSIAAVVRPLHVGVISTDTGAFVPFMALEWIEGETLDALVAKRAGRGDPPYSIDEAFRVVQPVARALARAHHFKGPDGPLCIAHCDVKPENILLAVVNDEKTTKILDFGIAQVRSATSEILDRKPNAKPAVMTFSPSYAAPEQWNPQRYGSMGPWTDVWGLALTLSELMAGHTLIQGDFAKMKAMATDPARRPTPRSEGVFVSDAVEAVFQRALAVDPAARHEDVKVFWRDLEAALGKEHTGPVPSVRAPMLATPAPSPAVTISKAPAPSAALAALDVDWKAIDAAPVSVRPRAAVASLKPPSPAFTSEPKLSAEPSVAVGLRQRFLLPGAIAVLGIALTVADLAWADAGNEALAAGPVPLAWVGRGVALIGSLFFLWRLMVASDGD